MRVQRILRTPRAALPYLAFLVTLLGMGNFFWFVGETIHFGGDALNGFVRDGHYYLAQHGTYTEVSRAIWEHIQAHEISVVISVPLVAVCFWYWLGYVFASMMGLRQGEAVVERARAVQASGVALASGRCGGIIGGVSLGGPTLVVKVYPAGITIRMFPRQPIAIRMDELKRIVTPRGRYGRVEITHRSPDIISPIELYPMPWTNLSRAFDWLATRAGVEPPGTAQTG